MTKEVQVKIRPGRVVNGSSAGEVITVTEEQSRDLIAQRAADEYKAPREATKEAKGK